MPCNFLLKARHDIQIKGTEVNRPLVCSFMFIWLGVTICYNCRCQRLKFPLFLSALWSLGFSRDFFLNNVWDTQFFRVPLLLYKGLIDVVVKGRETGIFYSLWLGPRFLMSLAPWAVTFTSASRFYFTFSPLSETGRLAGAGVGYFPSFRLVGLW